MKSNNKIINNQINSINNLMKNILIFKKFMNNKIEKFKKKLKI